VQRVATWYNIIIDGFGKIGELEEMMKWYRRMAAAGYKHDAVTYTALISAFTERGNIGAVESCIEYVKAMQLDLGKIYLPL
jgi:pentatricopeptide repeat protein